MPAEDPGDAGADKDKASPQQFCLRWNNYQTNLTNVFDQLLQSESFVDVTLACDGHSLKAHKMVLSACSPYFQTLFFDNPCQHPIVIMRDIKWPELKAAVEFMYRGEINVSQDQIGPLLKVAESLKIRGLADVNGERDLAAAAEASVPGPSQAPAPPLSTSVAPQTKRPAPRDEEPLAPKFRKRSHTPASSPPRAQTSLPPLPLSLPLPLPLHADDMEIKPGIAEMIREEERAKLLENSHAWLGASTSASIAADSYQYQLQSMWQKCWNTNQSLVHNLRFRERGPLKSWRPETMAEAIFSVLKEGLSLSQAARKYDIPYPTFVLYANRVHNMLGPSADGGAELRPKGRGRPQRILLGVWPDEHIRGVIRAVVFRDSHSSHHIKEEPLPSYPGLNENMCVPNYGNGSDSGLSPSSAGAAAAAVAAVAHGLRRQMCSMVAAAQRAPAPALSPPLCSPPPPGLEPPPHLALPGNGADHFRPFASPRPESYFRDELEDLVKSPSPPRQSDPMPVKVEPLGDLPRM